jgi:hypothetical protein
MSSDSPPAHLLAVFDEHSTPTAPGRDHTIYVCPGCAMWQVEVNAPLVDQAPATTGASFAALVAMVEAVDLLEAADEIAKEHRVDCQGLDMLAGLAPDHRP